MSSFLCDFDLNNLSVETCILELVKISLEKNSTSIAVRFDPKKHKIQVVDNGIGFSDYELINICNKEKKNLNSIEKFFNKLISLSNILIVTSRKDNYSHTYVKVVSTNKKSKLFQGYHRPSKGTTVTIYNFNCSEWDIEDNKNFSISYIIAAIALINLEVSFSLRNDNEVKLILDIKKHHTPWEVLKYFKKYIIYYISYQSVSQKIEGRKFNLIEMESDKEITVLNSIKIYKNMISSTEVNMNNSRSILSPLSEWSDWSYKPILSNTDKNNSINKFHLNSNQTDAKKDYFINLSQMSVWSDWYYQPDTTNSVNKYKDLYKYLPISMILDYKNKIESNLENLNNKKMFNMKRKFEECRISGNTINSLQILKQVNKEFIVAISNENGKKLLIMIDQHAVHERIRYEWLLETYRDNKTYKYFSIKLDKDIIISGIDKHLLKLLILYKHTLIRVGINIKSVINSTTCIVDTVPICFIKKVQAYNYMHNLNRLIKNVKKLLLEIANGLAISTSILPPVLPITINNVIASEACHEAIKFGDPLNVQECTLLIQALQDTKAPTRCAHGRPTMIPLIDLSASKVENSTHYS